MKRVVLFVTVLVSLVLISIPLSATQPVQAQSGGGYNLTWSTIDGGGYTVSTGGAFTLSGTIGQPDAGVSSGGAYTLSGGFWSALQAVVNYYREYLPMIQKRTP